MGSQQITHNKVIDIDMILIAVNYYYVEKIPYMYALNLGDSHKHYTELFFVKKIRLV